MAVSGTNSAVNLPPANSYGPRGMEKTIKRVDTDTGYYVRLYPSGSDTMKAGNASVSYFTVGPGETWEAVSDGLSTWHVWKTSV